MQSHLQPVLKSSVLQQKANKQPQRTKAINNHLFVLIQGLFPPLFVLLPGLAYKVLLTKKYLFFPKVCKYSHYYFTPRPYKLFPVKSACPKEEKFQKRASVVAALRVLAEFLGAFTATNSGCKGIIKAGKWLIGISCQNLLQSKGSTRSKRLPALSLHFHFTCTVLNSWHRYNTNVLGNPIANGANISKAGFAGVLYTSSSAETSYSNKSYPNKSMLPPSTVTVSITEIFSNIKYN